MNKSEKTITTPTRRVVTAVEFWAAIVGAFATVIAGFITLYGQLNSTNRDVERIRRTQAADTLQELAASVSAVEAALVNQESAYREVRGCQIQGRSDCLALLDGFDLEKSEHAWRELSNRLKVAKVNLQGIGGIEIVEKLEGMQAAFRSRIRDGGHWPTKNAADSSALIDVLSETRKSLETAVRDLSDALASAVSQQQ